MSTLSVDTIQGKTAAGTVAMPAGYVIQTLQFTAGETSIGNTSANTVINSTFTPKVSGSKFAVWLEIPNCTNTSGGGTQCNVNIGTSATPSSNTNIIYVMEKMDGTGAVSYTHLRAHET